MSIGRKILRMREKQGMNQTQLAQEVGITQSAIIGYYEASLVNQCLVGSSDRPTR